MKATHAQRSLVRVGIVVLAVLFGLLFCLILSGCRTQYIEVEKPIVVEHTTTQHHTDIVRDTLMVRDSTSTLNKGDTTIIERWHHVYKVDKQVVTDTVRDTVPRVVKVTKTVVKEVPRSVKWWEIGIILICFTIVLFLCKRK